MLKRTATILFTTLLVLCSGCPGQSQGGLDGGDLATPSACNGGPTCNSSDGGDCDTAHTGRLCAGGCCVIPLKRGS